MNDAINQNWCNEPQAEIAVLTKTLFVALFLFLTSFYKFNIDRIDWFSDHLIDVFDMLGTKNFILSSVFSFPIQQQLRYMYTATYTMDNIKVFEFFKLLNEISWVYSWEDIKRSKVNRFCTLQLSRSSDSVKVLYRNFLAVRLTK